MFISNLKKYPPHSVKELSLQASRMLLQMDWVHEIRSLLPSPTPLVFILPPVCSSLAFWWPTQYIPCFWSLYITPGFTACILFLTHDLLGLLSQQQVPLWLSQFPDFIPPWLQPWVTREDKLSLEYPWRWPLSLHLSFRCREACYLMRQLCALLEIFT